MIPDKVLMGMLLVTGTLLIAGVVHQAWSGITRHRRSAASRRAHKFVGYAVLALALVHLPLALIDVVQVFFG